MRLSYILTTQTKGINLKTAFVKARALFEEFYGDAVVSYLVGETLRFDLHEDEQGLCMDEIFWLLTKFTNQIDGKWQLEERDSRTVSIYLHGEDGHVSSPYYQEYR